MGQIEKNLNGTTEAVLYLWEKAEKHELLNDVCQQLVEGVGIETANIDMYLTGKHINRKRSNKESVISGENNEKAKIAIRLTESVKKSKNWRLKNCFFRHKKFGLHKYLIKITMSKERLFMSIGRNTSRC